MIGNYTKKMSELVEEAIEVSSIIIGVEPDLFGIFYGGVLPEIAVPDAPINSIYYRNTGETFKLTGSPASSSSSWTLDSLTSSIPFCNSDGSEDNIPLFSNQIPFLNSDGSTDNISLI